LTDAEDGSWTSEEDGESPVSLTLTADQPVYDDGVLKVNVSWSAGQSVQCPSIVSSTFNSDEDMSTLQRFVFYCDYFGTRLNYSQFSTV